MQWMKRILCLAIAAAAFVSAGVARAGQLDTLLDLLVEKGVITPVQAQQVRAEAKEEGKKEISEGMAETLASWVRNSKFKGDVRVRMQHDNKDTGTGDDETRDRSRVRVRYGFDTPINDTVKAGFYMASGVGEQTSTNQTFTNFFNQKELWIDKAYIAWEPNQYFSATAGKFSNPFFTTDLVWDGDINPEGFAARASLPFTGGNGYLVGAYLPLYEKSGMTSDDPYMWALQAGVDVKQIWNMRFAVGWYNTANLKGMVAATVAPSYAGSGNTLDGGGAFIMNYNMLAYGAQVTPYTFNACPSGLPLTIYGEYVQNTASQATDDTGYVLGFKLGSVKTKGDLQFDYNYRVVEKDAVVAALCDSDFHGGGTNGKGHKLGFGLGLNKNTSLNLTYFTTEADTGSKKDISILQADLNVKF